jgi:hypothetical protein
MCANKHTLSRKYDRTPMQACCAARIALL